MRIDCHAFNESLSPIPVEDAPFLLREGACIVVGREKTRYDETFKTAPSLGTKHLILIQDKHIIPEAIFVPGHGKIAVFEMCWHADEQLLLHFEQVVDESEVDDYFEGVMDGLRRSIDKVDDSMHPVFETACLTDDVLITKIINEAMASGSFHAIPEWSQRARKG